MLFYVAMAAAALLALYLTDTFLRKSLRLFAHFFPNDFAGPDGWLVDTRARKGVFD